MDLFYEFLQGFVDHALITLHVDNLRKHNTHHQAETVFKAFGWTLRMAVQLRLKLTHRVLVGNLFLLLVLAS